MGTKISAATKQLALQRLRDGFSPKEVADLTGLSARSIGRLKAGLSSKSAVPGGTARSAQGAPSVQQHAPETGSDEATTALDFEESPAPVEQKSIVDSALKSLKGMLGIADEKRGEKAPPVVLSAKLDARKQQFVDNTAPTLSLAFMALAAWLWGRIGPEYSALAPDDKVAQRIVEPLLRIYARHASFMTDVNPDVADFGASMFALIAYVHVSLGLYQQIKQEQQEYEQEEYSNGHNPGLDYYKRRYRAAPESRSSQTGGGSVDVSGSSGTNGHVTGADGGHPGSVDLPHLSDKEAAQHAALSRLSQLDFEHRARRSGRFN